MKCALMNGRGWWVVAAALVVVGAVSFAGQNVRSAATGREWAPEVKDALATYRAGDYFGAQQMCLRILSVQDESQGHHDAGLIHALCLLHMPARADRLDGRARLAQLSREDPSLLNEPECNLAYGIGQTELGETADALDALERSVEGFASRGLADRQLAALVALAQAWTRHTEWEMTPARFGVGRPADRAEADAIRRAQVEAVRARMEKLPDSEAALAGVDLILARHLLGVGDGLDEAHAILNRLAAAPTMTSAGVEACLLLAEQDESAGRWAHALALYERVAIDGTGEPARQAKDRMLDITRPQLVVEVSPAVPSGQPAAVNVRVRNVDVVQVEVRSVDVDTWLASSPQRGNEASLPESGSVQMAWDLEARPTAQYAWWNSNQLEDGLGFAAPAGAYVVVARGKQADGRETTVKRLVVVSDLSATCLVGPRFVTVWIADRPVSAAGEPAVKFWMQRSFAPTQARFEAGIARFALPSEARVMRDKGWVCLVKWGEHVAVCRGRLPGAGQHGDDSPVVAMVGGPPAPEVGEVLYVSGLVLEGRRAATTRDSGREIQLESVDAVERADFSRNVPLSLGGAFSAQIPVTSADAGKYLRVVPRLGGRTLENVAGPFTVQVPSDAGRFRVWCDLPEWVTPAAGVISGCVRAEYPWGATPHGASVSCVLRAVRLPTAESNEDPASVGVVVRNGQLDNDGRFAFSLSTGEFGMSGVSLAVNVEAHVTNLEARSGVAYADVLVSPQRPHKWLTHEPLDPEVGQMVRFHLGWFEPGGLAVTGPVDVEVRSGPRESARLRQHPGRDGLQSDCWQPPQAGSYQAAVRIPGTDGEFWEAKETIEVRPAVSQAAARVRPSCTAHVAREDGHMAVRVRLEGDSAGPLLVALVQDGDPLAAVGVERLAGRADLLVPLDAEPVGVMRAVVIGTAGAGTEVLCNEPVESNPQQKLELELAAQTKEVWPGTTVSVKADCRTGKPPSGTTLIARLIDATAVGYTDWGRVVPSTGPATPIRGLAVVSSAGGAVAGEDTQPNRAADAAPGVPMALQNMLGEGQTLWSASLDVESETSELNVPIPARPGLYRLVAGLRTPDDAVAVDAVVLDARRGVRVWVDAPGHIGLGDRTLVAALLENGYPEAVEARVEMRGGTGLHIESLRVAGGEQTASQPGLEAPLTLQLPAGGRAWLYAGVEAATTGRDNAEVVVTARGVQRTATCPYEVLPASHPGAAETAVRVKRTLLVRRAPPEWAAAEGDDGSAPARDWEAAPWSPGSRLVPGELLYVREEFVLPEVQGEFEWLQRVPATCCAVLVHARVTRPIGTRAPDRDDTLAFRVPALPAGVRMHEYCLAVVRPGSCVLPPPEWRVGEATVPVAVEPDEVRLIVVGE